MNKWEKLEALKAGKVCTWHLFNAFTAPTKEQLSNMVNPHDCPLCKKMEIK